MKKLNRTIIAGMAVLAAATATAAGQSPESGAATAQTTQQKPVKKYYMQVCCSQNAVNQSVTVDINLGRFLPATLGIAEKDLRQATSARAFPTEIDAVNFYASKGWTLVDSYTIAKGRTTSVYYIMMFETADPSEVGVSILTH